MDALIEQWQCYARSNRRHAELDERKGDTFGAQLHRARGEVRQAAAEMLNALRDEPAAAAMNMYRNAKELRQHHWSFAGFDQTALKYTRARTWQDCARALDPSLPEVQPRLTEP